MKLRRISLVLISVLFLSLLASRAVPGDAHGPSAVHLDYDFGTQVLTADVSHSVANPNTHYIIQIVIEKNSVHFMTRDYTSQPSASNLVDTFSVPAVHGDILTVTAHCNSIGSLAESITVSDPSITTTTTTITDITTTTTTTTNDGSTTTPTPPTGLDSTILVVAAVAAIVVIIIMIAILKRG